MGLDCWYLPILRIKYPAIKLNHQGRVNMVFPYWRVGNTTHMMVGAHACGICRVSYTSSESKLNWWWDNRLQKFKTNSSNSVLDRVHKSPKFQLPEEGWRLDTELRSALRGQGRLGPPILPPWIPQYTHPPGYDKQLGFQNHITVWIGSRKANW